MPPFSWGWVQPRLHDSSFCKFRRSSDASAGWSAYRWGCTYQPEATASAWMAPAGMHSLALRARIPSRPASCVQANGSALQTCASARSSTGAVAGSSRGIAPPGLPQIRTCRFPASGSSSHEFATSAIRWRFVNTRSGLSVPDVLPVNESSDGVPFPPPGPSGWFPGFNGTMRRCDFLTVFSPHFVSFAWRYLGASAFRPRSAPDTRPTDHPGVYCTGYSRSGLLQGTARISQVPGEPS